MQLLTNEIAFIANFTRANVCMDREIFKGGLVTGTLKLFKREAAAQPSNAGKKGKK